MAIYWEKEYAHWRGKRDFLSSEWSSCITCTIHQSPLNLLTRTLYMASSSIMGPKRDSYPMPRRKRAGNTWRAALMITRVVFGILEGPFLLRLMPSLPPHCYVTCFFSSIIQFTLLWTWWSFVSICWYPQLSAVVWAQSNHSKLSGAHHPLLWNSSVGTLGPWLHFYLFGSHGTLSLYSLSHKLKDAGDHDCLACHSVSIT